MGRGAASRVSDPPCPNGRASCPRSPRKAGQNLAGPVIDGAVGIIGMDKEIGRSDSRSACGSTVDGELVAQGVRNGRQQKELWSSE